MRVEEETVHWNRMPFSLSILTYLSLSLVFSMLWEHNSLAVNGQSFLVIDGYLLDSKG